MLGFLILSRAWFGINFVPLSLLFLHYFYMLVTIVMTISVFILFMFFVMMFSVYFDYILIITSLSLCLCISSYNTHSDVHGVGGRHCVSVVLIRCLHADTPYILGHVVDHGCDTPVDSFVVHSPNIGARRSGDEGRTSSVLNLP